MAQFPDTFGLNKADLRTIWKILWIIYRFLELVPDSASILFWSLGYLTTLPDNGFIDNFSPNNKRLSTLLSQNGIVLQFNTLPVCHLLGTLTGVYPQLWI